MSQASIRVSFVYIMALPFSIVGNFVFNLYNDPSVTNFIVVHIEDCSLLPSHIYIIRPTRRLRWYKNTPARSGLGTIEARNTLNTLKYVYYRRKNPYPEYL